MMATLLFHECPLTVIVTGGRAPPLSASTTSRGTSNPRIGSGGLDDGAKPHDLLLRHCVGALRVQSSSLIGHFPRSMPIMPPTGERSRYRNAGPSERLSKA